MKAKGSTVKSKQGSSTARRARSTSSTKPKRHEPGAPLEIVKQGSISIPIYVGTNIIPERHKKTGAIIYDTLPDGSYKARPKYQHTIYTIAYYEGSKRVRRKFSDLEKARKEAEFVIIKLVNGENEALKLTGTDRGDYVRAMQKLRGWKPECDLNVAVCDYVSAMSRLPEHTSLQEVVNFYIKRHPIGLPPKTVRDVVAELIESKRNAGKSAEYIRELDRRLGKFADAFQRRISNITGKEIEDYIRLRGKSGRTQNNVRRLLMTLFNFAIKRGYLPKDHDEMDAVERATVQPSDIEVFTPDELRKLFAACVTPVQERGKWRTREDMIPYLAIAAFCGLRAAEIERLDWSEVHLTGAERFIEVKAGKAKTSSRRTVPIPDNCVAWLNHFSKASGPIVSWARTDKQLFIYLAEKSGVPWKRNGLRHSYISYRVAETKNVHQTSLEAGNSPQMIFKHYRQLVTEIAAKDWFSISPIHSEGGKIIPVTPIAADVDAAPTGDPIHSTP